MTKPQSTSWSWRHAIISSDLEATTRHVLLTISCFMNDVGGGCYPTTKQLEQATGLSERSVCTHIAKAESAGWLTVTKHGLAGRKWKNHEYVARWPDEEGTERPQPAPSSKAGTMPTPPTPPPSKFQIKHPEMYPELFGSVADAVMPGAVNSAS